MLKIHETTMDDGSLAPVFLVIEGEALGVRASEGTFALPEGALEAAMARYAAPLETSERLIPVAVLDLGGGRVLRHVRHLARYDVIARDYLVYETVGAEPAIALAATIAGVLVHLSRAASR